MRNLSILFSLLLLGACASSGGNESDESADTAEAAEEQVPQITLVSEPTANKVDVLVDGDYFTSYIYPTDLEKPVLYPVVTASGDTVTRGFPRNPKAGERVDHPHHVGVWFNYGDVNGLDFWNNSYNIPEEKKDRYGAIKHREIRQAEDGDVATLVVTMDWLAPDGTKLLAEETSYIFRADGETRIVDRMATLTAQDQEVSFEDNKEGMFAIRVTRALELPTDKEVVLTDAQGNPTEVPVMDNNLVSGDYLSSEGATGEGVWGTRGRWMKLYGEINGERVAIAIIDHPENPGYPTYWHARGYGLFAANTLGQKALSGGKEELMFKLAPMESASFRYRMVVHSGGELTTEKLNELADQFAAMM